MSEPSTETTATAAEATTTTEGTPAATTASPDNPTPADLGDAGKQAIDRMKAERDAARREARANAEAAKNWAEAQEAQKTEQQKAVDAQARLQQERDEAKAEGLRYRAAATHGIGEDYFDLLGSGDAETISARAELVGGLLKDNASMKAELEALRAGKPAPAPGRPTAALKPGATPEQHQTEDDALYASIYGAPQ